jgi:cytochrome b involved in lipid metabolism
MTLKLPFLALVLIAVGLFLGGASYWRFAMDIPEEVRQEEYPQEIKEEGSEEKESEQVVETSTKPPPSTIPSVPKEVDDGIYTMTEVRTHASVSSCWSVINGNVYDLTSWISRHPGGKSAIVRTCGVDGTEDFNSEHKGDSGAESRLKGFFIGTLAP